MLKHLLFFLLISCFTVQAKQTLKSSLPVEAHASLPNASQMNLSPDGNKIAFVQNAKGTLFLVVFDLLS